MISGRGSSPALLQLGRGLRDRPHLQRKSPGTTSPSRTPRMPSIGFCSCVPLHLLEQLVGLLVRLAERLGDGDLDRQLGRSGRNSCSGGSSSRTDDRQAVHRLEDAQEVLALQRQQLLQRRLARLVGVRPGSPARRSCAATPRNMCSVRHSPMPCGAEVTGPRGVLGVSAFARTPIRRRASACSMMRGDRVDQLGVLVGVRRRLREARREGLDDRAGITGTAPANTSPVVPSMEIIRPR